MKRRSFFKATAITGSALAVTGLAGCNASDDKPLQETIDPYFEFNEATVNELQQKMGSGEITSQDICRIYLARIEEVDPYLRAVMELNPDSQQIAARLDEERSSGKIRGPLHGIPVMIKDNINTGDRMKTSAGSLALDNHTPKKDAFIIERLREAGAVLLGKTNLSEWANFRSTNSSSGWSGRGGQVRNPYYLNRNPCGSSSGTAVAVAANLCTIGIGTETNGSIVCPSGINGVVGIKPTLGLWSRRGIIPIAHSQDTAGPMGRTVTDAAILLGALAAFDDNDAETYIEKREIFSDYTQFLKTDIKDMRIGIASGMTGFHKDVGFLFEQATEAFKSAGAEIVENVTFEHQQNWGEPSWQVLLYEFKADLNSYLKEYNAPVKSLEELIEFNNLNADKEMPWFGQEIFEMAQEKGDLSSEEYRKAWNDMKRFTREEGIDAVMEKHQLDAIIAPTNGPSWTTDWVNGDHFAGSSSSPAAISGYPNITVPMGFVHGLPIGISIFGKAWSEPTLLKVAYAFEQATKHRKAPEFKKSIMEG
jgi:amidase